MTAKMLTHTDLICHPPYGKSYEKMKGGLNESPLGGYSPCELLENSVDPVVRNRPAKFQKFSNFYHRNCSFLLCSFINLSKKVFGRELTR